VAVLVEHKSIDEFLLQNKDFLMQKESFYNLPIGLALGIQNGSVQPASPLYFSLIENNQTVGCALRSHEDRPVILTEMPLPAIDLLIAAFIGNKIKLSAVMGHMNSVLAFQSKWCLKSSETPLNSTLQMHLGVYECKKILIPALKNEKLIIADISHKKILDEFIRGFLIECFPEKPVTDTDVENLMNRQLKESSLYLLVNNENEIVSMAANTRGGFNSGTISLVYTPNRYRRKGYAGMTVALLSEKILASGKTNVNLFTDLKNPTSNSVYQKIGFNKIGEQLHYNFI
jgi:predicted GNAT family acetyltransferase